MATITATYENGVFKPDGPVSLAPGARVSIVLPEPDLDPVAAARERFGPLIGTIPPETLDRMERDIEEACGKVDPDVWR